MVVCDDDDTLVRMRDYLCRAGVETRATRHLADIWGQLAAQSVVLWPDDFDTDEVLDALRKLLLNVRSRFVIIITAEPRLFEPLLEALEDPESVVIMPKPVWGWTILDLLRQRLEA